jgi:ATP-binding cassette, subfamily C (CFTR/MRP), member 1
VGSAGISLSGGQKQRLALARAVYTKKELVILDDVFSGLDAETEEQVFNRLLGKQGLFWQMKTTVLLVTHAVHRLSYPNHITALDHFGRIAEQGSYDQLKDFGGYVQGLAAKLKGEDDSLQEEDKAEATSGGKAGPIFPADTEEFNARAEELNRQTGDLKVYKYYFASIGWPQTCVFLAFVVLFGTTSTLTEFLLTYCKCLTRTPPQNFSTS